MHTHTHTHIHTHIANTLTALCDWPQLEEETMNILGQTNPDLPISDVSPLTVWERPKWVDANLRPLVQVSCCCFCFCFCFFFFFNIKENGNQEFESWEEMRNELVIWKIFS